MQYDFGKRPSKEVQRQWLDDVINKRVKELNEYESTFIDDMEDRMDKGLSLNDNQIHKLEEIYAKVTE